MKLFSTSCALFLCFGSASAQQYVVSTYAGGSPARDTSTPLSASIEPYGLATDSGGNVYFSGLNAIYKLDVAGNLTRVAGTAKAGYSGDGGPAVNAQLSSPVGVAVDAAGNLFIADRNNGRVRRVSPQGIITTIAGNGSGAHTGYSGDGGPAVNAGLALPSWIAVDNAGDVFFTDGTAVVRVIRPNGIIERFAGNGTLGFAGDGGPAIAAGLEYARGLAVDSSGNLYILESPFTRIRKVSTDGTISTIAGTGTDGHSGDGGPAKLAQLNGGVGLAIDRDGNLFVAEAHYLREIFANGTITTVAGNGQFGLTGDGGPALSASIYAGSGIAVDSSGNVYFSDADFVRRISAATINSVAGNGFGNYSGDGTPAILAQFGFANQIVDKSGYLFVADTAGDRVRGITPDGTVWTIAGSGACSGAVEGQALAVAICEPAGVAVDSSGVVYVSLPLAGQGQVSKIANGVVTTIASTETLQGITPLHLAWVPGPLTVDSSGNVFFIDTRDGYVLKIPPSGVVSILPTPSNTQQPFFPTALALNSTDDLFVADGGNNVVWKYAKQGGITAVAGGGTSSGDGVPATSAKLLPPTGVALDNVGNLYVTNFAQVRRVDASGIISTIAGSGSATFSGDGGPALSAGLDISGGIAVDADGRIFLGDTDNHLIRVLTPTNQTVMISAVDDAASESATPVSPGKIIVIYGGGLGPTQLALNQPVNGAFGKQAGGTTVSVNGIAAPMIYSSSTQVAAIVPYAVSGSTAQVTVTYAGQTSAAFSVPVAASAPSLFSLNGTGAGQAAVVNADGSINDAAHPVKAGGYVSLYATGEGQTNPAGTDGALASTQPWPAPILPVHVTAGGLPATVTYAGAAPTEVAGLMQVVIQIPQAVQPGGYVPVEVKVGDNSSVPGAAWIAVSSP